MEISPLSMKETDDSPPQWERRMRPTLVDLNEKETDSPPPLMKETEICSAVQETEIPVPHERDGDLSIYERDGDLPIRERDGDLSLRQRDRDPSIRERDGDLSIRETDGSAQSLMKRRTCGDF